MSYILAAALNNSPVCAVEHIERVFGTIVTNHVRIHVLRAVSSSVGLALASELGTKSNAPTGEAVHSTQ